MYYTYAVYDPLMLHERVRRAKRITNKQKTSHIQANNSQKQQKNDYNDDDYDNVQTNRSRFFA